MQGLMRVVCIAYLIFLTSLLLTKDPARLIGFHEDLPMLLRLLLPAAHFLSFSVLAVLSLMVRWPMPRWGIVLLLFVYAGMTEVAQSYTPVRTAEWADWLQDIAGIASGALFCWVFAWVGGAIVARSRGSNDYELRGTSEEWDVVRTVMSRPVVTRSQSWWE
jgi:hypothetical protein